jgi:nucleolar complex protein 2
MVKQSKRTRKFVQSGGIKARLEKGTISKKGKNKNNKRSSKSNDDALLNQAKLNNYSSELRQKREEGDFVSEKNLGDLDMESFFSTFADNVEEAVEEEEDAVTSGSDDEDDSEEVVDDDDSATEEKSPKRARREATKSEMKEDNASSDSDSEEENLEVLERQMKEELGKLVSEDPEFHEFLQENDESLLEYGNRDEDDEDDEEDDDVEMDKAAHSAPEPESPALDGNLIQLTPVLLAKLEKGALQMHGIKTLKKLVNAYKSACHLTDAEQGGPTKGQKYQIESSEVFDRLMVVALTTCHEEFHYHLLGNGSKEKNPLQKKKGSADKMQDEESEDEEFDANKPINPKTLEKSLRWVDAKHILTTFLSASMHILSEAKEPELVVYVLKSLSNYMPYVTPFPRLAESMLKTLTGLWSAPIDSSEDYQVVRLHSFLRIRQLALTQPFPFIEECLKKLYLAYAQRAKFATAASVTSALPTLTFMGNCVVELYSLDYHSSYQHAFVYIRQLALHLRTAMHKKTPEAMGAVYCWQYLHCLKLWVAVLTEACQSDDGGAASEDQLLRSLVFPLSQVILGTVSLIPSARYLPLRLHCVRLLQQLAAAAEMFVPTTSILLDVFDLRELSQPPKKVSKSNVQPLALTFRLRADNPLRSMEELEMCVSETFVLLNREADLYQYSPGFSEFSVRISQRLRKVRQRSILTPNIAIDYFLTKIVCVQFSKETRSARWRAYAKGCLELCSKYYDRAVQERAKLNDVAPRDVKQLELLKPMNTPSMGARYKQALEKEKRLEAATRPLQKTAKAEEPKDDSEGKKSKTKKRSKNKKKSIPNIGDIPEDALEQEDEVQEGINWSDDEE